MCRLTKVIQVQWYAPAFRNEDLIGFLIGNRHAERFAFAAIANGLQQIRLLNKFARAAAAVPARGLR
jgi:hypothetical protein